MTLCCTCLEKDPLFRKTRDTVLNPTPACCATSASVGMEAGSGLANCGGARLRRVAVRDRFFNPMIPPSSKNHSRLRMETLNSKAKKAGESQKAGARSRGFSVASL
jgi:hypothetical protein